MDRRWAPDLRTARFYEGQTRWPYSRQTPANDGIFGGTKFYFGPGPEPTDWLVVLNEIPRGASHTVSPDRAIFLSGEPPSVATFKPAYLAQFGTAVSVDDCLPHHNRLAMPPFVPWHVGIRAREPEHHAQALTLAQLQAAPPKTRLCSCITSNLRMTSGHRVRLAFLELLQSELGDRIDFFGRGIRPIADKDEGLAPYRYHIALENSPVPHYWTEKLADPLLRNCFPIYFGAPNIFDYFDPAALAVIDIERPREAIARIAAILDSDMDQRAAAAVETAKQRVMWDYNMFARLDRMMADAESRGPPQAPPRRMYRQSSLRWLWQRRPDARSATAPASR